MQKNYDKNKFKIILKKRFRIPANEIKTQPKNETEKIVEILPENSEKSGGEFSFYLRNDKMVECVYI